MSGVILQYSFILFIESGSLSQTQSLLCRLSVSVLQDWNYKWMTTSTWRLQGLCGSKLQSLHYVLSVLSLSHFPNPNFVFIFVYLCLHAWLYLYHIYVGSQGSGEGVMCSGISIIGDCEHFSMSVRNQTHLSNP